MNLSSIAKMHYTTATAFDLRNIVKFGVSIGRILCVPVLAVGVLGDRAASPLMNSYSLVVTVPSDTE